MDLPDRILAEIGDVDPHTLKVAAEVYERFGQIAFIWGWGSSGEHEEGRALDFMTLEYGNGADNPGPGRHWLGNEIAEYLWVNRERLGVWYVIWDRRIISMTRPAKGWVPYDGDNPHAVHVHVSFYNNVTYKPPEDDMPTANEVVKALLDYEVPLTEGEVERGHYAGQIGGDRKLDFRALTVHGAIAGRRIDAEVVPKLDEIEARLAALEDKEPKS